MYSVWLYEKRHLPEYSDDQESQLHIFKIPAALKMLTLVIMFWTVKLKVLRLLHSAYAIWIRIFLYPNFQWGSFRSGEIIIPLFKGEQNILYFRILNRDVSMYRCLLAGLFCLTFSPLSTFLTVYLWSTIATCSQRCGTDGMGSLPWTS